mgnify:CR=1 FL=1
MIHHKTPPKSNDGRDNLRIWHAKGQTSAWTEVVDQLAGVVVLPALSRAALGVLLIQAHQQTGQLAADHLGAKQLRQLRKPDEPVRIPGRPVVIGPSVIRKTRWWVSAASWSSSPALVVRSSILTASPLISGGGT